MHGKARVSAGNRTLGRLALHCAAILESVQDDRVVAGTKGIGDDPSAPCIADGSETACTEAHAGLETAEEGSVFNSVEPGPEQSIQAGPLSRMPPKICSDPTEILQALEKLGEMISERVISEIRAFRRDVEARLDVQDAQIDALYKLYYGLRSEMNGIRMQMRLLMALVGIQTVLLGALLTMGIIDRFGTDRVAASSPSLGGQAAQAEAEESASALDGQPPASIPASEDADRTELGTVEESQSAIPSAR